MPPFWKTNWAETREHFNAWWDRQGLVVGAWGNGLERTGPPHAATVAPAPARDWAQWHRDPDYVAQRIDHDMAHRDWPLDILPVAWGDVGTVPLAAALGAREVYASDTIWYEPAIRNPDQHPALTFDPRADGWQTIEAVTRAVQQAAAGHYLVGLPSIVPGLDVLTELRGTSDLLMDLIDRPDWVHEKLAEIDRVYVQAFDRLRSVIRNDADEMAFGHFMLWGQGRIGLAMCDTAAMLSPDLFAAFVLPSLRAQCRFLDRSLFHVDGAQCLIHLDMILDVAELDAIEFTPDPKSPGGGDPHWYPLYRRILDAGKSVWVANIRFAELLPLLDAIGGQGVYVIANDADAKTMAAMAPRIDSYRK